MSPSPEVRPGCVLLAGGADFTGRTLARMRAGTAERWVVLDNLNNVHGPASRRRVDRAAGYRKTRVSLKPMWWRRASRVDVGCTDPRLGLGTHCVRVGENIAGSRR